MTDQLRTAEMHAKSVAAKATRSRAYRDAGVPGRAEAIRAKCFDCIYDPLAGGSALAQVRACTCRYCPLWPYRPGADPLTELGPEFEARTPNDVLAEARR